MPTPLEWFLAIVGSGTVNALVAYFINKYIVRPVDKKIVELTDAIKTFNKSARKLEDIEKEVLNLKK